jgi:hypothetical protein
MADQQCATHRRYCFLKYKAAWRDESNVDTAWDAKRRLLPGTTLPTTFPARSLLIAAGYLVLEEVEGADSTELIAAGLTSSQAAAVLAALE